MAHEFRNGLATIHGYGRLLDLQEMRTDYRPYVEGIRQEAVALREVVDNFLSFARPAKLSLGKVSLLKLVERAAEEIREDTTPRPEVARCTFRGNFQTSRATRCCCGKH